MEEEIITLKVRVKVKFDTKKCKEEAVRDFKEALKGQSVIIFGANGYSKVESISVRRCLK